MTKEALFCSSVLFSAFAFAVTIVFIFFSWKLKGCCISRLELGAVAVTRQATVNKIISPVSPSKAEFLSLIGGRRLWENASN